MSTGIPATGRDVLWSRRLLQFRDLGIAAVVATLVAVFGFIQPLFLRPENLGSIVLSIGILLLVAIGQMMVIVTRNIDLSVGSVLGLAAMVAGIVGRDHPDLAIPLIILIAVGVGSAAGAINGLLVTLGEVPPIIATLGTLAMFRGLVFVISGSRQVDPQDVPAGIRELAISSPFGVPWLVILGAIVAITAWFLTRRTLTGRRLFAIGSNPEAARARGLNVFGLTLGVFVVSGALAGLGGVLYLSRYATVNPADAGLGFELTVISAVVIGGATIFGGSGSVIGTILGCVLVGLLANGLTVIGVSGFWQLAANGAIILIAVTIDTLFRKRLDVQQSRRRRAEAAA